MTETVDVFNVVQYFLFVNYQYAAWRKNLVTFLH